MSHVSSLSPGKIALAFAIHTRESVQRIEARPHQKQMLSEKTIITAKQNDSSKEHSTENEAIKTLPEHNPHVPKKGHRQLEHGSCLLQV